MPIAAIYGRVSTTDQKDNGTSLDTQNSEARLKAEQLELTITGSAARPGWDSCHLRPFNKDSMQDYSQLERFGVHYCHPTPSLRR